MQLPARERFPFPCRSSFLSGSPATTRGLAIGGAVALLMLVTSTTSAQADPWFDVTGQQESNNEFGDEFAGEFGDEFAGEYDEGLEEEAEAVVDDEHPGDGFFELSGEFAAELSTEGLASPPGLEPHEQAMGESPGSAYGVPGCPVSRPRSSCADKRWAKKQRRWAKKQQRWAKKQRRWAKKQRRWAKKQQRWAKRRAKYMARYRARSQARRGCPIRQVRSSCDVRGCDLARSEPRTTCGDERAYDTERGYGSQSWCRDRFAVGLTRGHFELGEIEARERGMLARIRVSRRLSAELEMGKTSYRDMALTDKRMGGSLLLHPFPRARLSPYLSASAGRIRSEMGEGDDAVALEFEQRYREVGLGLSVRLGKHLRLEGDLRTGRRALRDSTKSDVAAAAVASPVPVSDDERYKRARINAVLYF